MRGETPIGKAFNEQRGYYDPFERVKHTAKDPPSRGPSKAAAYEMVLRSASFKKKYPGYVGKHN